jgi:nucleoside-diphosphate-sugar epimerase
MLELLYQATGKSAEPPMTRFVALQLGLDHYFNIAAARRDLGFNPACNRQETLVQMKPWLKQLARSCSPK